MCLDAILYKNKNRSDWIEFQIDFLKPNQITYINLSYKLHHDLLGLKQIDFLSYFGHT